MDEVIWERRECVGTEVDDSLVLLDLETLVYHSLNKTAAAVWDVLAEPSGTSRIVDVLVSRYNVSPEQCRQSVTRLLGELSGKGLVRPVGTTAA